MEIGPLQSVFADLVTRPAISVFEAFGAVQYGSDLKREPHNGGVRVLCSLFGVVDPDHSVYSIFVVPPEEVLDKMDPEAFEEATDALSKELREALRDKLREPT